MAQPISNLSVGDKIKLGTYQVEGSIREPILWVVAGKNHYKDSLNPGIVDHVTLLTESMIDLRGFDAKEPSNSNSDRKSYGNNRYRDSNLRQWLNKSVYPWFIKTHTADEPPTDSGMSQPTGYDDEPGFLSNLTAAEQSALVPTTIRVVRNTVTDGGGSETVTDKIFLLSNTEVGLANENSIAEGSLLPLFSDNASRIAYATQQCINNTKSGIKPSGTTAGWYWWLRTPNAGYAYNVRYVNTDGTLRSNNAYYGNYGVRPALNLKSEILVSDAPGEDGAYIMLGMGPFDVKWPKQPFQFTVPLRKITFSKVAIGEGLEVHATNNPFATTPVWEDITQAVQNREAYIFQNQAVSGHGLQFRYKQLDGVLRGIGTTFE